MVTFTKACDLIGYRAKNLIDDRVLIRRETGGLDIITMPEAGRPALNLDDVAALILYADLRSLGCPVKVAGVFAARVRAAMAAHPREYQLVIVSLENGSSFVVPAETVDLTSGYTSGSYVVTATLVDCRNLRARAQRAIEADAESERADAAA